MRKGIHPDYQEADVTCACGESFKTRSTKNGLRSAPNATPSSQGNRNSSTVPDALRNSGINTVILIKNSCYAAEAGGHKGEV